MPVGTSVAAPAVMGPAASHEFEEHVGEARLRLHASSMAALLEEAARALAGLMGSGNGEALGPPLAVDVRAPDREALLAAWIDELLFLSEKHKRVWIESRVELANDTEVRAVVRGIEPEVLRTQVKAATLHDLRITDGVAGGLEATLVLDV
jgi:SHS2 domain-containing protein